MLANKFMCNFYRIIGKIVEFLCDVLTHGISMTMRERPCKPFTTNKSQWKLNDYNATIDFVRTQLPCYSILVDNFAK